MTPAKLKVYQRERLARRRADLVVVLGGVCVRCGATDELEFDHIDPASKSFTIANSLSKPWPELLAEIAKCQLLCHPCHKAKSNEDGSTGVVEHGGGQSGKKNCPCELCRARKAEYMRKYMKTYQRDRSTKDCAAVF